MATHYGPKKGDESCLRGRFGIRANVPRFFKIISDSEAHKLRLPTEFTKRYGNYLPARVFLKVPNGLVWKIELIHSNGETWLNGGWQLFEEYYSIRIGHFLTFGYIGDAYFEVHIFNTTATEIEYSYYDSLERNAGRNQVAEAEEAESESESDDSVVFVKEISAGKNKGRNYQDVDDDAMSWKESRRNMRESDGGLRAERLRRSARGKQNTSSTAKNKSRFPHSSPNHRSDFPEHNEPDRKQVQLQARDDSNSFKAYERALEFMSVKPNRNPFTIVVMHPSYACADRSFVNIPSDFSKEILLELGNSSILLVCEGKTWQVKCINYRNRGASLSSGWGKFVEDNDLKAGDACVFEVSKRINLEWEVIIFRR
ncbi:B3 domain-containing transcription factor VRN1-like [Henckelia pumila]|uniref:B3 domain-containing transcription factor VRN1-like n=1 Tax=Henckelia pumila TaxID=405737 RepID=UPI003C6E312B